ncbi:MAG: NHL repeat-containing protein [Chloroflexota bacterium]|nr:NHL repeat-containing protein [Chloroflexota bacterium]
MDGSRIDRFSKIMAAASTRRTLARVLAMLPLAGAGGLLGEDAAARRKQHSGQRSRDGGVQAEKKKPRIRVCLKGKTIRVPRRKMKRLKKKGATRGRCKDDDGGGGGGACTTADWSYTTKFGSKGTGDSELTQPHGVAISPDGLTVWVADTINSRVVIWVRPDATSLAWTYSAQFGSQGTGDDNFDEPQGLAVSPDGLTAWVADVQNHRVMVWARPDASSPWAFSAQIGSGVAGSGNDSFDHPIGVAASEDGLTVWVVDSYNHRVVVWVKSDASSPWEYSAQFGSFGAGDDNLNRPYGVSVSPDGRTVWVVDSFNRRVVVWTRPDADSTVWTFSTRFGSGSPDDGEFGQPQGVAVLPDGLTAWVSDVAPTSTGVTIWTRPDASSLDWTYGARFGSKGSGNSEFSFPWFLAVLPDGQTVWVSDASNDRVVVWARTCPA